MCIHPIRLLHNTTNRHPTWHRPINIELDVFVHWTNISPEKVYTLKLIDHESPRGLLVCRAQIFEISKGNIFVDAFYVHYIHRANNYRWMFWVTEPSSILRKRFFLRIYMQTNPSWIRSYQHCFWFRSIFV